MRVCPIVLLGVLATACGADGEAPDELACDPGVYDVAVPEDAPYRLVVDSEHVYWTSAILDGPKRIRRASLVTGQPETLAETSREVGAVSVDADGTLYWVESAPGSSAGAVMVLRPGGAPEPVYSVAAGLDPFGVAIDATDVYWIVHGRGSGFTQTVFHGPKGGGTAAALGSITMPSSDQSIGAMVVDADHVYWSNGGNLVTRLAQSGGGATTLLDEPDGVAAFAIEDGLVYAIVRDAATSIVRVDASSGSPVRTVVASGSGARWSLAVAQGRVFAATNDDRIVSIPTEGGATIVEVTEGVRTAGALAIAGPRLYWASTATSSAGGAVRWICREM